MKLPDGVQLSLTELDAFPELRGPEGTIPVVRPSFLGYIFGLTGASSFDDFLTRYLVPGDPTGQDRLYAGMVSKTPNLGASTWINSFNGITELGTTSLLEMVVGCRDPNNPAGEMWQQIGIAASRDWATKVNGLPDFGGPVLKIQVEFLTAGAKTLGNNRGGWAGIYAGFTPVSTPTPLNIPILNPSAIDGPQYESLYDIRLWSGDWWVGWNGSWLGYYSGKLFGTDTSNLLISNACEINWYGEVYDSNATTTKWTLTDMGSGEFASAGWGKAANFRNPSYTDVSGTFQWPDKANDIATPLYNPACYTKTNLSASQPPWDRFFYVGGPGGDAPNLDCPKKLIP
jgi:hypothetical protein